MNNRSMSVAFAVGAATCLLTATIAAFAYGWAYEEWGRWGIFWTAVASYIVGQIVKACIED